MHLLDIWAFCKMPTHILCPFFVPSCWLFANFEALSVVGVLYMLWRLTSGNYKYFLSLTFRILFLFLVFREVIHIP